MDDLEDLSRRAAITITDYEHARSRPLPNFVGGGRRLMAVVLGIVAMLIVARGVTLIWTLEEAWNWMMASAVARKVPHGPMAIGMDGWVTPSDYPQQHEGFREKGALVAGLSVSVSGDVADCWIEHSSGSGALDDRACDLIRQRGRFRPARNARGEAVAATIRKKVTWQAPPGPEIHVEPYDAIRVFRVGTGDRVDTCRQWVDGVEIADPDCRNGFSLQDMRKLSGTHRSFGIAGRTTVKRGDAPPAALPNIAISNVLAAGRRLRMVLRPDGRLTNCAMTLSGKLPSMRDSIGTPTPCELGETAKPVVGADGIPKAQFILIEDRISVREFDQE